MKYAKSKWNTVKRSPQKAHYDKAVIHAILDAVEICTVAFIVNGRALAQPINFGRKGETLYLHGSYKNRMTGALIESGKACLSVMLLDSMKLTRSAFHHSVNYRSAVIFGTVSELKSDAEKLEGLRSIINHFVPGRWAHCRHPNRKELDATRVLAIHIDSASAKIADAAPTDNKEDFDSDYWAGTLAVRQVYDAPRPVRNLKAGIELPAHVRDFYEKKKNGV